MTFNFFNLGQDLRYSVRLLIKNPLFACMVIGMLTIGIGVTTTMFSVVNAVFIEPLPYHDPDRLIRLWESNPSRGWPEFAASVPNFHDWQKQNEKFEELAASEMATFNLTGYGEPQRVAAAGVTANLFPVLGVNPLLGRSFLPEEEKSGHNRVVVLSYGLWQRQFGADKTVVGKTIQLNNINYEVIGIMPARVQFPAGRELWVPLVLDPAIEPWRADRGNRNLAVYGRLKPGVTLEQATASMNVIARRLELQNPRLNMGWGVLLRTFPDWLIPKTVRQSLLALSVAVGLVLLIACANVASLLLTRGRARLQEIAIRAALGANRIRVMRQLLAESLVLASLGGIAGLLLTIMATRVVASTSVQNIPRLNETSVDGHVVGFAIVVSILTGFAFGLAPAWWVSHLNLTERLNEGTRTGSGTVNRRLGGLLVITEVALALALLICAGLMGRSFARLQSVSLGFAPENILTMQISLPGSRYASREQRVNFFDRLLERVDTIPGVINAAAVTQPPTVEGNWAMEISFEGGQVTSNGAPLSADSFAATPHYFQTMGIPLLQGRDFTDQDRGGDKPLNLIVSQTFVRRYWPNQDPIGKRFRPGTNNPYGTVVGVVGDVRRNLQEEPQPAFYFPYGYIGMPGLVVVVRSTRQPEVLVPDIRSQIRSIDNQQPVYNIRTMEQIISNATVQPRFRAFLLGVFSIIALLLAAAGIYSVMAYIVRQRWREIGVRMALGADAGSVRNMILNRGMRQVLIGIVLGIGGCLALAPLLRNLLFQVRATDPFTFFSVALLIIVVALAACYVPAARAAKIDPSTALREE